jgi:hypothetical protein
MYLGLPNINPMQIQQQTEVILPPVQIWGNCKQIAIIILYQTSYKFATLSNFIYTSYKSILFEVEAFLKHFEVCLSHLYLL